jgi:hypothetical protein
MTTAIGGIPKSCACSLTLTSICDCPKHTHDGIKLFLQHQQEHNLTYLSLGKYMYKLDNSTGINAKNYQLDTAESPFALSQYPFLY